MERPFFTSRAALQARCKTAAPGVSSNSSAIPEQVSKWAEERLGFIPSPKQRDVLDAGSKYMILCCNRQWGKTTVIAIKALHRALTKPHQTIVIISRTKVQAGILIMRACNFAAYLGYKIRRVLGHNFSLRLPNGSAIFAVPHTSDTSVGNTADVLIVDEAALVKDEVFFSVSPAISRTKGAIWLMSTPRRQAGFFYNIWHAKDDKWKRIFATVKDCPDIDQDFLDMQRLADETRYRQDFECEFLQPPGALFTVDLIRTMLDP